MIVNWKGKGILTVPVVDPKSGTVAEGKSGGERQWFFVPGYSEVPDEIWGKIKPHLREKLATNLMDELAGQDKEDVSVPTGQNDANGNPITRLESRKIFVSLPLRKIPADRALNIVRGCFDLKSLTLWERGAEDYEPETRSAVLSEILHQIRLVKSGGKEEQASVA